MDHSNMTGSDRAGETHRTSPKRRTLRVKHPPGIRTAKADKDLSRAPAIIDPRREIETDLERRD